MQPLTIIRRIFWLTFLMERRFAHLPFVEMLHTMSQTRPCMRLCFVGVFWRRSLKTTGTLISCTLGAGYIFPLIPRPHNHNGAQNAMTHSCYDKAARLRRLRDISGPTKPESEKATHCCVLEHERHIKSRGPVPHIRATRERAHPPPTSNHQAPTLA